MAAVSIPWNITPLDLTLGQEQTKTSQRMAGVILRIALARA
jgi:hypothetical protein